MLGAKRALKPHQVWAIRFWLDQHRRLRDRALFDFAIDSKLRGCDVVKVPIGDIVAGGRIRDRAMVVQQKTKRPVQFELVEPARKTLIAWLERRGGTLGDYVFPSRNDYMGHMSTRQYARLVREWVTGIGLQAEDYARARSAKRRRRSSTRRLAICARCRSCLATPRSRAPSATSVLMWRTRWSWRNVRRFDQGSAAFTTQRPRSTAWITATQSNYGRELTSAF